MELLDRYLQAVKPLLPRTQREDILAELSENIQSQMEDKESELDRPLTQAEQETVLKRLGHPMLVAARYRQAPLQYLIGPVVFPVYWFVLKSLLGIMLVVCGLNGIALLLSGEPVLRILRALLTFPRIALPAFGWVTLEFAVLDLCLVKFHLLERLNERWNPRSLPPVVTHSQRIPRSHSVVGLAAEGIFLIWWLAVPHFPYLLFGPAVAFLKPGPAWQTFYVPVLLLALAGMARQCIRLFRPHWIWLHAVTGLVTNALGSVMMWFVLKSYPYVIVADSIKHLAHYGRLAEIVNVVLFSTVLFLILPCALIAGTVYVFGCLQHIRRSIRRQGDRAPSGLA